MYQSVHVLARKWGLTPGWVWLNRILTFLAATVAWVFFRASSMRAAVDVLKAMVGLNGVSGDGILRVAPILAAFIVGGLLWVNLLPNTLADPAAAQAALRAGARDPRSPRRCWR